MELQDSQILPIISREQKDKIELNLKCIKNFSSNLACNNSQCQQYAFVCNNKDCECREPHKKCLFTCTDQILQLIHEKKAESTQVIDKVCSVLDKWLDQISDTREKIESMLRDWGLSGAQKKFITMIKNEEHKQLTGHHIHQITTQSIQYFSSQTRERLMSQIQQVSINYNSQITHLMNTMTSLFDKYQIDQKDTGFSQDKELSIQVQYDFLGELENFRRTELKKVSSRKDYDRLIAFFKEAFKKDFESFMQKYKRSRRAYGTEKLRQKYFEKYFSILSRGQQYIYKWQNNTKEMATQISKCFDSEWKEIHHHYRQSDGLIDKPFTPEMALSLHKIINVIYLLVDFIRENGKRMLRVLTEKNKSLSQNFQLAIYFLDGLMDAHPEIDEVEVVWNVIRFEEKIKNEVNFLYEVMEETKQSSYEVEIEVEKIV